MTEELKLLQQVIDELDGADEWTRKDLERMISTFTGVVLRPHGSKIEDMNHRMFAYQESWINWKAKQ